MDSDIFGLLGLSRHSHSDTVTSAYWAYARALGAARDRDPDAGAKLDELNAAYERYAKHAPPPQKNSSSRRAKARRFGRLIAAGTATAFLAMAVMGIVFRQTVVEKGSAATDQVQSLSTDGFDRLKSLIATPTPAIRFFVVANTGGDGVLLRDAPSYSAPSAGSAPDGTGVAATGDRAEAGGESWLRVRTATGAEGWVSTRWLAAP